MSEQQRDDNNNKNNNDNNDRSTVCFQAIKNIKCLFPFLELEDKHDCLLTAV